jgi:dTDP-4-dehydrorhamnose reductase
VDAIRDREHPQPDALESEVIPLKLLITGASGLYGSKLAEIALQKGHVVYSGFNQDIPKSGIPIQFDVSNMNRIEEAFRKATPEVVVHAASLTDVDKCENNKKLAWKINVEGTRNVAEQAKKNQAFLTYISTDYVFNGEKGRYIETDTPDPVNYYGLTKLNAENAVKKFAEEYCVARPCVIYGASSAAGKVNFALWLINKLRNKEKAAIVTDQWITPTLNTNLADMTLEIAERRLSGIYHVSGATRLSRYEYAELVAQIFELDPNFIVPVTSADMSWAAKRPRDSSLDTSKAEQTLKNKPLKISEALEQLKRELS